MNYASANSINSVLDSNVVGSGLDSVNQKSGEITNLADQLRRATRRIHDCLDMLAEKLSPVLVADVPQPTSDGSGSMALPSSCQHANDLQVILFNAEAAVNRIMSIHSRAAL